MNVTSEQVVIQQAEEQDSGKVSEKYLHELSACELCQVAGGSYSQDSPSTYV